MLVLLTVPRKLVLGAIARPMSRLLILIVGLVGVLREPGVVGAVTVAPMLVVAIHAVPLFAIPTAAIIISVASPISLVPISLVLGMSTILVTTVAREPGRPCCVRVSRGALGVPAIGGPTHGVEIGCLGVHVGVGRGLGVLAVLSHARWQTPWSSIWHLRELRGSLSRGGRQCSR